jgi:hypothetical protein
LSTVQHKNENYAGVASRDTASALGEFTKIVRGVAATSKNSLAINAFDEVIESYETNINPRQILGVTVDSLAMSQTPENSAAQNLTTRDSENETISERSASSSAKLFVWQIAEEQSSGECEESLETSSATLISSLTKPQS